MNRQVTIQLPAQVFNHISTLANINEESVAHYISNYIVRNMVAVQAPINDNSQQKIAVLKQRFHSLKGIAKGSPMSDKEAIDEYISEKYGI